MYKAYQAKSYSGNWCWPPNCEDRFGHQSVWFSLIFIFFVGKMTSWLQKFSSFPAFPCFLTWKNLALKHVRGGNPGSTEVKGNVSLISEMPGFHPGTRMVVPCHNRSEPGTKLIPLTSKQNQTTLRVWRVPHFTFHESICRQLRCREQGVLCLKCEQRSERWSSAMTHIWQPIFLSLLSGTALRCSTETF